MESSLDVLSERVGANRVFVGLALCFSHHLAPVSSQQQEWLYQ